MLHRDFIPALFGNGLVTDVPRQLACLTVKKVGLVIPVPTASAESNWTASMLICSHLIAAIRGTVVFRSGDHSAIMAAGKVKNKAQQLSESQDKL